MRSAPEPDRMRDRGVVDHSAVNQVALPPAHRREHAGDRGGRKHRLVRGSAREQHLASGDEVEGHHMQGDGGLLEHLKLQVPADQAPQATIGHKVVVPARHPPRRRVRMATGKISSREMAPQARASWFAVVTVCGREAMKAALSAPADVPTRTSGTMPRS
jgi:hypothetical protein